MVSTGITTATSHPDTTANPGRTTSPAPPNRATDGLHVGDDAMGPWVVRTHKPINYEVRFRDLLFAHDRTDLVEKGSESEHRRRFVVVDDNVDLLHGDRIRSYFDHHGVEAETMSVASGEGLKNFETATRILERIDAFGIARRQEPLIVIGGGVLMDVVGLVASLYRRGTPFVRVPTTLIGLVDAGVGAKTGVNANGHKNRIGTYFPADLTLLDRTFLATVDRRHISNGMAEILKIALIKDRELFDLLERYGPALLAEKFQPVTPELDRAALAVLRSAIHGMLEELQPNLWEAKLERCVDYGHTFSPTVEMRALPELLHGEAVCVDMALTTAMAYRRGLLRAEECERVFAVMRQLDLPSWDPILEENVLVPALEDTVRHRDGMQRLPLPLGIGGVTFVNDVTADEVGAALQLQRELGSTRITDPVGSAD